MGFDTLPYGFQPIFPSFSHHFPWFLTPKEAAAPRTQLPAALGRKRGLRFPGAPAAETAQGSRRWGTSVLGPWVYPLVMSTVLLLKMAIEIVDFPINSMVDLSIAM